MGGGGAVFGSGNGEAGGAAAVGFGFFGFGRCGFLAGFGGMAGASCANTGFGSAVTVAGVEKSPGFLMTFTGTLAGWCLFRA